MPDLLVFSALIPKLLGAKVVLDLHDPMPELYESLYGLEPEHRGLRLLRRIEKWSIGFSDLALTPNIAFKNVFVERSCQSAKVQVIMNSPDEEIFRSNVLPSEETAAGIVGNGRFQILFHGSLVHRHGLDIAVEALAEVQSAIPNARLVICGARTPYLDSVMQLAKARGVEGRVIYLGMKTEQQIARIIASSSLGVVPNRRSTFTEINMPTRIFEFLALGKPVVAPSTQGIRDYFTDENLIFFEPGDAKELGKKFAWVYHNSREASNIVQRGRSVYRQNIWPVNRGRFLSLIAGLLEKRLSRPPIDR